MTDLLDRNGLRSIEWGKAIVRKSNELLGKPEPVPDAFGDIFFDWNSTEQYGAYDEAKAVLKMTGMKQDRF